MSKATAEASVVTDTLRRATAHHQRGDLDNAETLYRMTLMQQPKNFDALHLLGVLMHQRGKSSEALDLIGKALQSNAQSAAALSNRAIVLNALGKNDEALMSYDQALALKPDYAEALNGRGNSLRALGRIDEALDNFARALALRPDYAEAHNNRGNALVELGHPEAAIASYDQALTLRPTYADALINRGNLLRKLNRPADALASFQRVLAIQPANVEVIIACGNILHEAREFAAALAIYDRAIALRPDFAPGFSNRGNALRELDRTAEALECFNRAIALDPTYTEAYNNRGNALLELNRPADALADYDHALAAKSDYAFALANRGNALRYLNRIDDALDSFDRAIAIAPDLADAHWNRALLNLARGDFARGFPEYEWRWRRGGELVPRDFTQPQWQGEDLAGKTILLHAEQGFGDSLQFLRYLPMVKAKAAAVILELPDSLMPLLGDHGRGVTVLNRNTAPPAFDVHCPMMSLPLAFGTTIETIPAAVPYLSVDAARLETWRTRLPRSGAMRVGLVWSGKPSHKNDHNRSIPLSLLVPLLSLHGVEFVSLQQEYRDRDRGTLDEFPSLKRLDGELSSFADTAAVIEQLDLVIAVDTAVAHLTGALGKPLWLLLPRIGDWRWLTDRDDSPWYPSAQLFRQPAIGDWDSVISRLREALASQLAARQTRGDSA